MDKEILTKDLNHKRESGHYPYFKDVLVPDPENFQMMLDEVNESVITVNAVNEIIRDYYEILKIFNECNETIRRSSKT